MHLNSRSRRVRWFMVIVWTLVLSVLVYPAHTIFAQSDGNLFLPLVNTRENNVASSDMVATKVISSASQQEALEFWTHEALAAAKPLEVEVQLGPITAEDAALVAAEVSGPPGFSPAGAAAPGAEALAQSAYADDWAAMAAMDAEADSPAAVDGTSQIYTHYVVNQNSALWQLYPHVWVGRISFTTPSGTSYCSGTSISNNIMLTAAHCLYDSTANKWFSNWVFTPAYRNGSAPYGSFPATTCRVMTAWVNLSGTFSINSWSRYDVGVCNMGKNSAGTTLNAAVGFMGRQWNYPYVRHFHALGYPFNKYNDAPVTNAGKYLHACVAESFQQTTDTRGFGCDVSRGMSGGPWMVGYAPAVASGAADGVTSGFFIGTQNLYAIRFTSSNIVTLCTAAGC